VVERHAVEFRLNAPSQWHRSMDLNQKVGVSASILLGTWEWPMHGLRHPPTSGTSGWYVWTGEMTDEHDFFHPWHASHLVQVDPSLERLLHLPPGSRFLIAPGYEDVWHDPAILDV
jgi:hypothetical protein